MKVGKAMDVGTIKMKNKEKSQSRNRGETRPPLGGPGGKKPNARALDSHSHHKNSRTRDDSNGKVYADFNPAVQSDMVNRGTQSRSRTLQLPHCQRW